MSLQRGVKRGALAFIGALIALSLAAPSAFSAAKWEVSSSAPTTAAAGEEISYAVRVRNLGDSPALGTATLDIELPEGLSLVEVIPGGIFDCTVTPGASTASCLNSDDIPPTAEPIQNAAAFVVVLVDPSATGVLSAKFAISGGGPEVSPDTTVDPTRITTEPLEFGADAFEVKFADNKGDPVTRAGGHPNRFGIQLDFNRGEDPSGVNGGIWPVEPFRGYRVELPAGFGFNPSNFEQCTTEQLANINKNTFPILALSRCPVGSQVGATTSWSSFGNPIQDIVAGPVSLYNMVPPPGVFARFGVNFGSTLGTTDIFMRPGGDGFTLKFWNAARGLNTIGFNVDFWGDPGDAEHDMQRSCPGLEIPAVGGPHCPPATMDVAPLLRNPTSCTPPGIGLISTAYLTSWTHPDDSVEVTSSTHGLPGYPANPLDPETPWGEEVGTTDCDDVPTRGDVSLRPTTEAAGTASGLDLTVSVPNAGLENGKGISSSDIKAVKVSLPEGVTINPARAEGLQVCSPSQYAAESLDTSLGGGCPGASRIGTVSVDMPYLDERLEGNVFVAQPDDPATEAAGAENPFDSLLALYLVIRNPERGVFVKLAGKVEADPASGRLTTTVGGIPQQPFDTFALHLDGGPRSPLVTPPTCGKFTTEAELTPWSDSSRRIESTSDFSITNACSASAAEPRFRAGTLRGKAGSFSPFVAWFDGRAGNRAITKPSLALPPGLAAKLAGIARCSEVDLAATRLDPGTYEASDPICPAASRIGRTVAGFGVGQVQAYSNGHLFLAGPYRGAPLSIATVIPATVGPYDLGTIVQRSALVVDPKTTAVTLDAGDSDAIPSILSGVALHLVDLRLHFDKPGFTLNPTSCSQMAVGAPSLNLSSPFAALDCSSLGFKPGLSLRLTGNTARGGNPSLATTLRPRPGDANLRKARILLPASLRLDRASIGTVCSRSRYRRAACPKGAVYGYAKAVSPLLDRPLQGPVYLRASRRALPDLVVALDGQIALDLSGRLLAGDAGSGAVLGGLPDVPLEKLTLHIDGGGHGLLVNANNPCRRQTRVEVRLDSGSGRHARLSPELSCEEGAK